MRDCARRPPGDALIAAETLLLRTVFRYSIGRPRGFGPRGNALSSAAISPSPSTSLPAAALSAACSGVPAFGIANTMAGASEKPARSGAATRHARQRWPAAARPPGCAMTENHCDRTANRRRPRRRAARTTGSPHARWRAPADDRAPDCRRSCPCPRLRAARRDRRVEIADAPGADFAGGDQFVERRDCFLEADRSRASAADSNRGDRS